MRHCGELRFEKRFICFFILLWCVSNLFIIEQSEQAALSHGMLTHAIPHIKESCLLHNNGMRQTPFAQGLVLAMVYRCLSGTYLHCFSTASRALLTPKNGLRTPMLWRFRITFQGLRKLCPFIAIGRGTLGVLYKALPNRTKDAACRHFSNVPKCTARV